MFSVRKHILGNAVKARFLFFFFECAVCKIPFAIRDVRIIAFLNFNFVEAQKDLVIGILLEFCYANKNSNLIFLLMLKIAET